MSTSHIVYIFVSLALVALVVYLGHFIKNKKGQQAYLVFWTFLCFFFHISTMYLTFFTNRGPDGGFVNHGNAYGNQLFPIYFCNFIMYLNLVCAIWNDKSTRLFKNVACFSAWGGIFGSLITLFSTNPGFDPFLANPSAATFWGAWPEFQSAFSHTCLLIGSLLLIFQGHVKLSVYNLVPYSFGIVASACLGGLVMLAYYLGGKPIPNAMYMLHGPAEAPGMHGGYFALAMIAIIFVITAIYEEIAKRKDKSSIWYNSNEDLSIYLPIKVWKRENKQLEKSN